MKNNPHFVISVITIILVLACINAYAQDTTPVSIAFDKNSKRIDLITKKELPDYKQAKVSGINSVM